MSQISRFMGQQFDIAIVGGGIIGAGIARDAAMRGLKVALVEMADFGHGTSAASTRLAHGGLRYLEQYDFKLVRQDLKEREILLRIAPHLVHPLRFLIPVYRQSLFYRVKLRAGMVLYDLLSYDRSLPGHRWYSAAEALEIEPGLNPDGLQGAFMYYDGQIPSVERLCLENILSARDSGAVVANYARTTGFVQDRGSISGVEVEDHITGERGRVRAKLVVNATGPWLDETLGMADLTQEQLLRRTQGIHLVTPASVKNALVLFASDGRLFFVIPWLGQSLVGTTDTDFDGDPGDAEASARDVEYLIDGVKPVLPGGPWDEIEYTTAGVRALIRVEGINESSVPRGHMLVDHERRDGRRGLMSVVGGKITAYRDIAREAVDMAEQKLGNPTGACHTDRQRLPGGHFPSLDECIRDLVALGTPLGLDRAQCDYLVNLYGSRSFDLLKMAMQDRSLAERLDPELPDIVAQVRFAVEQEMALTVADFMLRRSHLGFSPSRGVEAVERVTAEMGQLLGWDDERRKAEASAYLEEATTPAPTMVEGAKR